MVNMNSIEELEEVVRNFDYKFRPKWIFTNLGHETGTKRFRWAVLCSRCTTFRSRSRWWSRPWPTPCVCSRIEYETTRMGTCTVSCMSLIRKGVAFWISINSTRCIRSRWQKVTEPVRHLRLNRVCFNWNGLSMQNRKNWTRWRGNTRFVLASSTWQLQQGEEMLQAVRRIVFPIDTVTAESIWSSVCCLHCMNH